MSKQKKVMDNPFSAFAPTGEKTAFIKALGTDVKYRELTMEEGDVFRAKLVKGLDDEGKPILDITASQSVKYEKVAKMLIEPSVTASELKGLTGAAAPAINEILALLGDEDEIDNEGN